MYTAPCILIDAVIDISTNNLSVYTNESCGCNHCTEQVVLNYMTLKVGDRQKIVYQVTYHGPFWIMDYEERRLSIFFSLRFWRVNSDLYAIFIILTTYICLYTNSTLLYCMYVQK